MTSINQIKQAQEPNLYGYRQTPLYQRRIGDVNDKERLFQLITDYQYARASVPLANKNVVLHCIQAGGLGDVSQTYLYAKKIQNQIPQAEISVAIQCEDIPEEQVKALFPTDRFPTEFVNRFDYFDGEKKRERLRAKTGCMIGVAVPIWEPGLLDGESEGPSRTIKEYGFAFHSNTKGNTLSMGLSVREEGILFPEKVDRRLYDVQTPWLKETLNIHSPDDEDRYLEQRTLYHMYMPRWGTQMISLYSIAAIEKNNSKSIDVFMPIKHSIKELAEWGALDLNALKENGIGKLIRVTSQGTECIDLGPGKEMRILSQAVKKEDVPAIQKYSQPLFGCTGNVSFSEGIVQDKLLIYDLLVHQAFFDKTWHQIIDTDPQFNLLSKFKKVLTDHNAQENQILQKNTPRKGSWYQEDPSYELSESDSVTRKAIHELARDLPLHGKQLADLYLNNRNALLGQAHAFNTHLQENYNCASRIIQTVSRGLVLTNYPHLVKVEKDLWQQFNQGRIGEEQVVEALSGELDFMDLYPSQ